MMARRFSISARLQLGSVRCQLRTPNRPELVPQALFGCYQPTSATSETCQVHFVETPAHMTLLQWP